MMVLEPKHDGGNILLFDRLEELAFGDIGNETVAFRDSLLDFFSEFRAGLLPTI